jgi:hypothetical protein
LKSVTYASEVFFGLCAFMVAILLVQADIPDHLSSCYFTTWAKWALL